MLGSASSIAGPNIILNTIVAEELSQFAEELEQAKDMNETIHHLICRVIKDHKRIIFNGDGYSEEWVKEAERRGLLNLKTTADALPYFISDKNKALFFKHKIFTDRELQSRYEIFMEEYAKKIHIEALTMKDMAEKQILPAISAYSTQLASSALEKKALSDAMDCTFETETSVVLAKDSAEMYGAIKGLSQDVETAEAISDVTERADFYQDTILPDMDRLRSAADHAEGITAREFWPFPSYMELLFSL